MIEVAPQAQVELEHSAAHVAVSGEGHIAAISSSGSGTFFAPNLTSAKRFTIAPSIRLAELTQDGGELAVTTSTGIAIYSTAAFEQTTYLNDAFESCLFARPGLFWTCAQFSELTKVVEVRDAKTKTRIARRKVADLFSGSVFILFPHPSQNGAVILSGAGQDGQYLYWATLDADTIQVKRFKDIHFASRPAFLPHGREFLVNAEGSLQRYSYPDGPLLGEISELAGDRVGCGDSVCLDERHALVTSTKGRLFVVGTEEMKVVDEVSILGFEGRPTSPFQNFLGLAGNRIVSIHGDRGTEMEDKWIHLAVWSVPLG